MCLGKEKKGKGKKCQSKGYFGQASKKKDLSKIECFHYHELGHYATKYPHKKANKKPSEGATCEALASQFELDFTLIVHGDISDGYCVVSGEWSLIP